MAKCSGRLIKPVDVDDERHFKVKGRHINKPDARKLAIKKVMTKIKHLARTTHNTSKQIIAEATTSVKSATAAKLPSIRLMQRTAKRARTGVSKNCRSLF